jgi:MFS family permease
VVAAAALVLFAWHERRAAEPMLNTMLVRNGPVAAALVVNCLMGVGLVIALINVPLFVNIVEGGIARSAVRSGWLLTALTVTMAITSYVGGLVSGRVGYRPPVVTGLVIASSGLAVMGIVWAPQTGTIPMALQLALVGGGIGLVIAPTSTAVIDAAGDDERGTAAGLVIVARLIGFSIGLAGLTAWGLRRYDAMRSDVELPPISEPGYADALTEATVEISTSALAETFIGAAVALLGAVAIALLASAETFGRAQR